MVKKIVDKIKETEAKSEKLIKDAETDASQKVVGFDKEKAKRLKAIENENEAKREELINEAEEKGKAEETKILADAQAEMNSLRAGTDKKKGDAVKLIIHARGVAGKSGGRGCWNY